MIVTVKMLAKDWQGGRHLVRECDQGNATRRVDALDEREVHVWRIGLKVDRSVVMKMESWLEESERSRAASYVFADDRRRFIVARGALRWLLGGYLGCDCRRLRFRYGPHGKPDVESGALAKAMNFNLSHCGDLALCAFARSREVGLDVENLERRVETTDLAECLSAAECAALRELAPEEQRIRFLELWTRKEALLKARGVGLSVPPSHLNLSGTTDQPSLVPAGDGDSRQWWLSAFRPDPKHTAALAVSGERYEMSCWEWSGTDGERSVD